MALQISSARTRQALGALAILLLAGCATVETQTASVEQPATSTPGPAPSRIPVTAAATSGIEAKLPVVEIPVVQAAAQTIDLTSEIDDLLQRMRHGFSMPDINNDLVLYHQQWYLNRPDYLRRMVDRSSRYLHHIVEEIEKRGMPMELALLPMVESAYNPMAYSRAKASGLWQFIPSTGKRYKLDQDWWKDERRDILASTEAALEYLQSIYEMHGDWHLALASYNWGEGAVGRAIARNRTRGLPTDYLSLTMPKETQNYVPKLQALKNIFNNPALLAGLELGPIPNRPYFSTITPGSHIDVKVAAKLAEMPVQEFVALNPAHNRPVIKSETPIVIPSEKLETFVSNLEAHESGDKPLSSWQSYTMRPGDKLEKIAQRFGMSVASLKSINGIKARTPVVPGTTLLVAAKGSGATPSMAALPEQPKTQTAVPDTSKPASANGRTHTVRKGETLQTIARRYATSVTELKRLNPLRSERLVTGTRLVIDSASAGTRPERTAVSGASDKPRQAAGGTTQYTVRVGDTLYSIARQFKVAIDDLMRWNRVSPETLKPGKKLTIQLAQNP